MSQRAPLPLTPLSLWPKRDANLAEKNVELSTLSPLIKPLNQERNMSHHSVINLLHFALQGEATMVTISLYILKHSACLILTTTIAIAMTKISTCRSGWLGIPSLARSQSLHLLIILYDRAVDRVQVKNNRINAKSAKYIYITCMLYYFRPDICIVIPPYYMYYYLSRTTMIYMRCASCENARIHVHMHLSWICASPFLA